MAVSTYPARTIKISLLKLNYKKGYQAAYYTTGFQSLKLYEQCAWGQQYPISYNSNKYSNREIARSPTGSSGHKYTIRK
ncbi:hypothetical protein HJFPF1_12950 [Paramyrothecium foliicola]|nr:hypothetical protein HJFPF1_12950 [Paramyrothecium foliicola]